jgi:hypothetical protein
MYQDVFRVFPTLALTWPQCRGTIHRELEEATQVNYSIKQAATPQT